MKGLQKSGSFTFSAWVRFNSITSKSVNIFNVFNPKIKDFEDLDKYSQEPSDFVEQLLEVNVFS